MAFNNNANNSNLHACSSTNSGPKRLSFLDVVLNKKEGSNPQADRGGFVARSDGTVSSPRSLRARTNFGNHGRGYFDNPCQIHEYGYSASPGTSYATPTMWRDHPRHPQSYQPTTTSHSTQRYYPATLDRVSSTVTRGMRDPIRAPTNYWEGDGSGPSARAVYTNAQNPHRPSTGLRRTGLTPNVRFAPYVAPHTRFVEYGKPEPELATSMPVFTQYPTQEVTNHSGEASETTANAENQTVTEEEVAPRKAEYTQPVEKRVQNHFKMTKLCVWAQKFKNLDYPVIQEVALETALSVIKERRRAVYTQPHLRGRPREEITADGKGSKPDVVRRRGIRRKFEELSKYYELGGAQKSWATTKLLKKVLEEVSEPPEPSSEPPAQGSTRTRAREDTRPISRTTRGKAKRNTMDGMDESGDNLEDTGEDSDEGSVWEQKDSSSDSDFDDSELEW